MILIRILIRPFNILCKNNCVHNTYNTYRHTMSSHTVSNINIFDRKAKRLQRENAFKLKDNQIYDYIKNEIAFRVADRVFDIKRRFSTVLELGSNKGYIGSHLSNEVIDVMVCCDSSQSYLNSLKAVDGVETIKILLDEENMSFKEDIFDMVLSSLSLHWINDLPNTFNRVFQCLKSDGVFIASMFGGETLFELRCALQMAELEREGGFAPHISPFVTPQDIASLLNRSGFTTITIDSDEITINYPTMFELMQDLKGMAENNALFNRKTHLHRDTLLAAAAIYQTLYGNKEQSISATFQIFYMIGWKPHESQQKPAQRGSADFSLKDITNLDKILKDVKTEN